MSRKRIGYRRYSAIFQQHNGNVDANGNPTYSDDNDWSASVGRWPCELITATGGEVIRGRQVSSRTTHVLFGEYNGADQVTPDMRVIVNGNEYGIVSALDSDGTQKEMRIELQWES